ncbi:hypothetical protein SAMN04487847_2111 [Microbacterium sp. cf332]|nr:hypothetical protein SAMN04487847_2111 [Microbacterium sp. cf332]
MRRHARLWGVPNTGRLASIAVVRASDGASDLVPALRDPSKSSSEEHVGSATLSTRDGIEVGDVVTTAGCVRRAWGRMPRQRRARERW